MNEYFVSVKFENESFSRVKKLNTDGHKEVKLGLTSKGSSHYKFTQTKKNT